MLKIGMSLPQTTLQNKNVKFGGLRDFFTVTPAKVNPIREQHKKALRTLKQGSNQAIYSYNAKIGDSKEFRQYGYDPEKANDELVEELRGVLKETLDELPPKDRKKIVKEMKEQGYSF